MLPPLPRPEDYNVSPETGFLPSIAPLQILPHPAYDRWERIINNFQSLLLSKRLRPVIDNLPVIPAVHLYTDAEWRRAYSVLIFLAHGYIWGGEKPAERLPPSITYPLLQVCEYLELPPVATYAGLVLWNWKPIFLSDKLVLENLSTNITFTGSLDEQWFYLVSVAMEARAGPTISTMLDAMAAARSDDRTTVTRHLRTVAEAIDELGSLLVRMYKSCDPHVFYHRIRPYLAGSKNMQDAGLPRGVYYDDGRSSTSSWRKYGGGSNAQSSLLQFLDVVLGVEHRPTGQKAPSAPDQDGATTTASESEAEPGQGPRQRHNFIHDMRSYMPGPHRRFLQAVESAANIRPFVEDNKDDRDLTLAYDACLAMLRALRDKHIQMVSRYIIVKSREVRSQSRGRSGPPPGQRSTSPESLRSPPSQTQPALNRSQGIASIQYRTTAQPSEGPHGGDHHDNQPPTFQKPKKMRGTGGTALIPFLKQARDETGEPAIDAWARKILTGARRTDADREVMNQNRFNALDLEAFGGNGSDYSEAGPGAEDKVDETPIVGLAGAWDMEESGGGICSY